MEISNKASRETFVAPLPPDEAERLASLQGFRIVGTPPEPAFDDIALLASEICGTPIALVSLVDEDRQWFKAHHGLAADQSKREGSFCSHAILEKGIFEVTDAWADPRFEHHPFVLGDPGIRFYAGAPLLDEAGHNLGTLCVIDRRERTLTPVQRNALMALGRMVMVQMRLRASHLRLQESLLALDPVHANVEKALRQDVTNHISHKLATPLTPMLLQLSVLRQSVKDPQGLRALDLLERNLSRLGAAMKDVVAYTAGRAPLPGFEVGHAPKANPAPIVGRA